MAFKGEQVKEREIIRSEVIQLFKRKNCKSSETCDTLCFCCINSSLQKTFPKTPLSHSPGWSDFGFGHGQFGQTKAGNIFVEQISFTILANLLLRSWTYDEIELQLMSVLRRLYSWAPVVSRSSCYWLCWRLIWELVHFLFTWFYLFYHVFITLLFWWLLFFILVFPQPKIFRVFIVKINIHGSCLLQFSRTWRDTALTASPARI